MAYPAVGKRGMQFDRQVYGIELKVASTRSRPHIAELHVARFDASKLSFNAVNSILVLAGNRPLWRAILKMAGNVSSQLRQESVFRRWAVAG